MGRELRRVPLDFDWPLNKVWSGFICDLRREPCAACDGHGSSPAAALLRACWYQHLHADALPILYGKARLPSSLVSFAEEVLRMAAIRDREVDRRRLSIYGGWSYHLDQGDVDALAAEGRLSHLTHRPLNPDQETHPNGRTKEPNGYRPIAAEVNTWAQTSRGMGHDSLNAWVCILARCKRYRVAYRCSTCRGSGHVANRSLSLRIHHWKPTDPPTGDGWQLWETVSEGSPITPVFASPELLASWLVNNDDSTTKGRTWEEWMKFLTGPGWAMSAVTLDGQFMSGVEFMVKAS